MEQSSCLFLLLTSFIIFISFQFQLCLGGDGEKVRINPEELEKVVQFSNLTKRDRTEKNVNFAWKVTVRTTQSTTLDDRYTSTLSPELNQKNNEIYDKLFAQLAYTLRDKVYLDRWITEMDKGYHIFLYEIQKRDKFYFIKQYENDNPFQGPDGEFFWDCTLDFLQHLGNKNQFYVLLESLKQRDREFPIRTTLSEAQVNSSLNNAYNTMFINIAHSFKNYFYRRRWTESYNKGFQNFLYDLKTLGPSWFIIPRSVHIFEGDGGSLFWENVISFFKHMKENGYEALVKKIDSLSDDFNMDHLINKDLPDIETMLRESEKTGTLTPIDWNLYEKRRSTTPIQ